MVELFTGFNNRGRNEDNLKAMFSGSESDGNGTIYIDGVPTKVKFRNKEKNGKKFLYVIVTDGSYKDSNFIVDLKNNSYGIFNGKYFMSEKGNFAELKNIEERPLLSCVSPYIDNT